MTLATQTKMAIGYNNVVRSDIATAITLTNCSANTSFPKENLLYDDPWRMMKVTSAPSANPQIDVTISPSYKAFCAGIINHNIISQGYTGIRFYYNDGGFLPLTDSIDLTDLTTDADFLVRFTGQPISTDKFRVQLEKSSGWPTFYIGAVFFGRNLYEVANNPVDGQFVSVFEAPLVKVRSAGSATHVIRQAMRSNTSAKIQFQRATQEQGRVFAEDILRDNRGRLVAVVPPDQVHVQLPVSGEHLFGWLDRVTIAPRGGMSSTTHRADITMDISGAK